MVKRFGNAVPGLKDCNSFPFLTRLNFILPTGDNWTDEQSGFGYPSWIWLIPGNGILYCQKSTYGFNPQIPSDIKIVTADNIIIGRLINSYDLKLRIYEAEYKRPGYNLTTGFVLEIQSNNSEVIFDSELAEMVECAEIAASLSAEYLSLQKKRMEAYIGISFVAQKSGYLITSDSLQNLSVFYQIPSGYFSRKIIYNFPIIQNPQELFERRNEIFVPEASEAEISYFLKKMDDGETSDISVFITGLSDDGEFQLRIIPNVY